ncbi:unnamed protein product, partial [Amoebophrya sp. A25]
GALPVVCSAYFESCGRWGPQLLSRRLCDGGFACLGAMKCKFPGLRAFLLLTGRVNLSELGSFPSVAARKSSPIFTGPDQAVASGVPFSLVDHSRKSFLTAWSFAPDGERILAHLRGSARSLCLAMRHDAAAVIYQAHEAELQG